MKTTDKHNQRVANMKFSSIYPLYLAKIEKKGRTKTELNQVIEWLTGFDEEKIESLINQKINFKDFFKQATLHPNAHRIKGLVCGYRIEEIDNATTRQTRYLDKLVGDLARGRKIEKILSI